jgi:thiamine transport system permease protein
MAFGCRSVNSWMAKSKTVGPAFAGTTPYGLAPLLIAIAVAFGLLPLLYFAWKSGGVFWPDAYAWRVLRFTVFQAGLSTVLSVAPAMFVARALARRRFFGRDVLLALFAVPLSLPVIVAVFGLTALYGTAGLFAGWINLYGLGGILLAHVFFNLPLATRLTLETLNAASSESHRLAAQLNFSDASTFRHVDWPILQPALPRIAALVFLLCASSFIIVLVFGGPQATTLEVAIYQSLRMDFDVSRALTLTVLQIALSSVLVLAAAKALVPQVQSLSQRVALQRYDGKHLLAKMFDAAIILLAMCLVVPVLLSLVVQGVQHLQWSALLGQAILTSFCMAFLTCAVALPFAWGMAQAQTRLAKWRSLLTILGLSGFIVPPAVVATGWFLVFRNFEGGVALAVVLIAMLNTLMVMPFLMTVLAPALARTAQQNDRLCAQLGLQGWNRFKTIDAPALRGPLAQAVLMIVVLSMGDLTAVTLLGAQGLVTLPSLVQQQLGHYQSHEAGGTALILALICLTTTVLAQRFSRWT